MLYWMKAEKFPYGQKHMPNQPVEKEQFIRALKESHQALVEFVSALPAEERTLPGAAGD